jgi:hypothetical protein
MVKAIVIVALISLAVGTAVLAVAATSQGCDLGDAISGSICCSLLALIVGLAICGLVFALRRLGGYISVGVFACLALFWQHVLPAVCVEVICHALGLKK